MSRTVLGDLDLDPGATVYHCGRVSGNPSVIHLDRDCFQLTNAVAVIDARVDTLFGDAPVCLRCLDEDRMHGPSDPNATRATLEEMDPGDLGQSIDDLMGGSA